MKAFSKKELAWIHRLQKTIDAMPKTLQVFDNETGIAVYKGELPERDGGIDSRVDHETVYPPIDQWECGDW